MDRRKSFMKLLDFGLARPSTASGPIMRTVAGTPQYIAPERLRGEPPQPSMDIYAVGIVGYELLCGRPPFDGDIGEVIDAHFDRAPPPFSTHGVTNVDERAEALIMRALAKSPTGRQNSMAAFLYELRTLMAMLGMGRRRAVTTARPNKRDEQDRARGRLFDVAPIPLAGVDATGRIVVANQAFAKFVTGDLDGETAGVSVAATRLTLVFPDIMAELRQVHISGKGAKRVIQLRASNGEAVDLLVWMMPGSEDSGDVTLAIHPLPRA
jgi:PAS domain-containing protein